MEKKHHVTQEDIHAYFRRWGVNRNAWFDLCWAPHCTFPKSKAAPMHVPIKPPLSSLSRLLACRSNIRVSTCLSSFTYSISSSITCGTAPWSNAATWASTKGPGLWSSDGFSLVRPCQPTGQMYDHEEPVVDGAAESGGVAWRGVAGSALCKQDHSEEDAYGCRDASSLHDDCDAEFRSAYHRTRSG